MNDETKHQLEFLRRTFMEEARVLDARRGYISASSFNLRMQPEIMRAAARVIADHFCSSQINVIHGIPHGGNYLATAVALAMAGNVRLHASRKDQNIPTSWKEVYHQEVRSSSLSGEAGTVFAGINLSFVRPGERILLIDDICASGETGSKIIAGLVKRGVKVVGFAVMFDKMFQGGLKRISRLGVEVYSCIRVKEITSDGQIKILS
ncbi:hypothetical protein HYU89_01740 [Candidatus Collierbacteria bacterium]|nr:hypothetical protein [Candidatus Collierbacteria bacterium]